MRRPASRASLRDPRWVRLACRRSSSTPWCRGACDLIGRHAIRLNISERACARLGELSELAQM
ncbi:hypothetical protein MYA_6011 [Burkholderia sp. KJ006]|nr:hypothetical protein MYA_6011 [Burkholderia sp. KJ006]